MSTDYKFEAFWVALVNGPYDFPAESKPYLMAALKSAGFFDAPTVVTSVVQTGSKTKKLSGYNVFTQVKMAELKEEDLPSKQRMTKVGASWQELSDEEKSGWKTKAASYAPVSVAVKSTTEKAPKKLTGYQYYVKVTMPLLKKENVPPKDRMSKIGQMWKALEKKDQEEYKTKAGTL
jgi:hypothetical protein